MKTKSAILWTLIQSDLQRSALIYLTRQATVQRVLFKSHEQMLASLKKHKRITIFVPTVQKIHSVRWRKKHLVIGDEHNLQLEIFLIADILGLGDIKPTQAISIPSNPTECCSCDALE